MEAKDSALPPPATNAPKATSAGWCSTNQTLRSTSDGQHRMFKKALGVGACLSFIKHCVMEHRNGMVVASEVSQATGRAEREAALRMARSLKGAYQTMLGADEG